MTIKTSLINKIYFRLSSFATAVLAGTCFSYGLSPSHFPVDIEVKQSLYESYLSSMGAVESLDSLDSSLMAGKRKSPNTAQLQKRLLLRRVSSFLRKAFQHSGVIRGPEVLALSQSLIQQCQKNRLDIRLVLAVIQVESGFHPWAVSPKGAIGLMQIMPETGAWLARRTGLPWRGALSLLDPRTNLSLGISYLAYLKRRYSHLTDLLAAFNEGPARVDRRKDALVRAEYLGNRDWIRDEVAGGTPLSSAYASRVSALAESLVL